MNRRLTRTETLLAAGSLVVALAGGIYVSTANVSAQGPGGGRGFGGPGMGRMGGPGGPGGPGRGGPDGPGGLAGLQLGRVNLTDAQKDQVKQILDSHKAEQQQFGEKSRAAHDALEAAITAENFDINQVRAKASDVAQLDVDAAVTRAQIRYEVYQILTSEQKAQVKKDQQQMQERRAEMEKRRADRGK